MSMSQNKKNKTSFKSEKKEYEKKFMQTSASYSSKTPPFWREIILELLQKRKYSASQIAYRSGISKTIIHKLLNGITQNLSQRNFRKLLGLYCRVCYDFKGDKKKYSSEDELV